MKITESVQNKMLKNRNDLLMKEIEQLKAKNKLLETQLSAYKDKDPNDIAKSLAEVERLKDEYTKLLADLHEKMRDANECLKQSKVLLNKQGAKFEKNVDATIKQINKNVGRHFEVLSDEE